MRFRLKNKKVEINLIFLTADEGGDDADGQPGDGQGGRHGVLQREARGELQREEQLLHALVLAVRVLLVRQLQQLGDPVEPHRDVHRGHALHHGPYQLPGGSPGGGGEILRYINRGPW